MQFIVIGGGWYGCRHTRQLLKAIARGKVSCDGILVVDRDPACAASQEFADQPLVRIITEDWLDFLSRHFPDGATNASDQTVPTPFAPHLYFDWLRGSVQSARGAASLASEAFELELGLPFEQSDASGNRYISAAGWVCPVSCIEPQQCPAIRGPRTWELGDILRAHATTDTGFSSVALFTCRHYAFGVGTIPATQLLEVRSRVLAALDGDESLRIAVATVSACHGVVGTLTVIPSSEAAL